MPILIGVVVSLIVNVVAGLVVARQAHLSRRAGFRVGLTVLARGEFSLILASLAVAAGLDAAGDRLHRRVRPRPLPARPRARDPRRAHRPPVRAPTVPTSSPPEESA